VRAAPGLVRLVLPSPNGSATSRRLASTGVTVVGGCLRNASAVGAWVAARSPGSVAVVAAGERWPDGSLRPALEDLLGAGAVLAALGGERTPDAAAAVAAYVDARGELATRLRDCPSGRELIGRGFAEDVEIAAELDASAVVPVLRDGVFRDAAG
jgi:2-phosphosulfolactate phosphatase